jgi:hypothetical protein
MTDETPIRPPPPPPPIAPSSPDDRGSNSLAYVGSIALLALVTIPQLFVRAEDNSVAYRIGRAMGTLMMGLLVGYFIHWAIRRSRSEPMSKWSPWVFVIAAGVVFVASIPTLVRNVGDGAGSPADPQEAGARYVGPADSYFVEPAGFEYRELSVQAEEAMQAQIAAEPGAEDEIDDLAGRQVVHDGAPVGAILVFLMSPPPGLWEETHAGFQSGFEEGSGIDLEPRKIDGVDAASGSGSQGTFLLLFDRNLIILVVAGDENSARELAEAQTAALD